MRAGGFDAAKTTKMRLYFMGICGTAMGNAALLARAAGHEVLGADSGVYPPMSTVLAEAGIYPSQVVPARATLETVFLGMTGEGGR